MLIENVCSYSLNLTIDINQGMCLFVHSCILLFPHVHICLFFVHYLSIYFFPLLFLFFSSDELAQKRHEFMLDSYTDEHISLPMKRFRLPDKDDSVKEVMQCTLHA